MVNLTCRWPPKLASIIIDDNLEEEGELPPHSGR